MGVGQVSETSGGGIAGVRTRGSRVLLRSSSGGGRASGPHVGGSDMRTGRPHSGNPCSLGFASHKLGPHPRRRMKKETKTRSESEMLQEYDFGAGVRGK